MMTEIERKKKQAKSDDKFKKTRKGIANRMYCGQKYCSKERGHPPPDYTLDEFREWLYAQPNFEALYLCWVDSGYKKEVKPSANRIDNSKPYTLDNIELITVKENEDLGRVEQYGEDKYCHICQRPKDAIGSDYCSYPHPIARDAIEQYVIKARIEQNLLGIIDLHKIDMKFGVGETYRICSEHNDKIHENTAELKQSLGE